MKTTYVSDKATILLSKINELASNTFEEKDILIDFIKKQNLSSELLADYPQFQKDFE